jgi:hypothetical protein
MHNAVDPVALAMLALGACATSPTGWHKAGANEADLERDEAQCRYEAKSATASDSSTASQPGATAATGRAIGDGIFIAEKQIELTNDCINLRGYAPR